MVIHCWPTAARLKLSSHRARAACPIDERSAASRSSRAVTAVIAATSSTGTMKPVAPSSTTELAPGTEVATTGIPVSPASISTPGIPSPAGRLGKTMTSA